MKQLFKPGIVSRTKPRNPVAKQCPMLDEGSATKVKTVMHSPITAPKTELKKNPEPKKKRLSAKQFSVILSAVMMFTFMFSQASALIGCCKSTVDNVQKKMTTPIVAPTDAETLDEESKMNQSFIMPLPNQLNKNAKPVVPSTKVKKDANTLSEEELNNQSAIMVSPVNKNAEKTVLPSSDSRQIGSGSGKNSKDSSYLSNVSAP